MIWQILTNGIIAGSIYALVGLGFAIIYSTVRFFHFAHGAVYTIGAYLTFSFYVLLKLPFALSALFAVFLSSLFGVGMEFFVYKPLRNRQASALILLIASLGLFISLQNSISLIFGDDTKTIRGSFIREGYQIGGAYVTDIQIIIILTSLLLFIVTTILLKHSKIGKALRAVANDQNLAMTVGIDTERIVYFAYFIGSILAAVASIMISLDIDMVPLMGFNALLYGIVAVVIGGLGNIIGAYLGGVFLGLVQHFGTWFISSKWQDVITFMILVIFLLFRPQGFFGRPIRKSGV